MKPEEFIGEKVSYDNYGQFFWGHKGDNIQMIGELRGWGAIQTLFSTQEEAAKFQDELGKFIADAINEKLNPHP